MKLDRMRNRIDRIDRQILHLLSARLELVKRIKEEKRKHTLPIGDKSRECTVLTNVSKIAIELGISAVFVRSLYTKIISYSKKVQKYE